MNIAIIGAGGRMGRMLVKAVVEAGHELSGAAEHSGSEVLGQDAGVLAGLAPLGVSLTDNLKEVVLGADAVIDFTLPCAFNRNLELCKAASVPLVIGTTGLSEEQEEALNKAALSLPIVQAGNYSVGVNLSLNLLAMAAKVLGNTVDVEVIEAHHRHKVDAPSGTAWMMAEAVASSLGRDLKQVADCARVGHTGARERDTIGIQTIRGGDIVGEHTVMFIGEGERVEIKHTATSRMNFASGAVRAAAWLTDKSAGRYDMQDVLGLKN